MIPVIAVSGFKKSGKTTLCRELAARFQETGIQVGFVKRTHDPSVGCSGTDTGLLLEGGVPTLLWAPDGLRAESRVEQPDLSWILDRFMPDVDLVILEGGKSLPLPRVWVGNPEECPSEVKGILAWFGNFQVAGRIPCFRPGQENDLAAYLLERLLGRKQIPSISLHVDGRKIPLKPYIEGFLGQAILGMIRSLKGTEGRDITIHIRNKGAV
jgi:molybdopterin-guanine dinucleotide biosynthesis protein B